MFTNLDFIYSYYFTILSFLVKFCFFIFCCWFLNFFVEFCTFPVWCAYFGCSKNTIDQFRIKIQLGNNMNLYLGGILIFFDIYMAIKLYHYDIFTSKISAIDQDLIKLFGSDDKLRKAHRTQFRFEVICITIFSILYLISNIYDSWAYPP